MNNFKRGESVICLRYEINPILTVIPGRVKVTNQIDMHWFNRKAKVIDKYESKNNIQYKIQFADDGTSLAWVGDDELVAENPFVLGLTEHHETTIKLC